MESLCGLRGQIRLLGTLVLIAGMLLVAGTGCATTQAAELPCNQMGTLVDAGGSGLSYTGLVKCGGSYIADPLTFKIVPPETPGTIGGYSDVFAVRGVNGEIIGCRVEGITLYGDDIQPELAKVILDKEGAEEIATCNDLYHSGFLNAHDTRGNVNDHTQGLGPSLWTIDYGAVEKTAGKFPEESRKILLDPPKDIMEGLIEASKLPIKPTCLQSIYGQVLGRHGNTMWATDVNGQNEADQIVAETCASENK